MRALFVVLGALVALPSFAATSACEVFSSSRDTSPSGYASYTVCDGKQIAVVNQAENEGTATSITKALQVLLVKGYSLGNCTSRDTGADCFLTK